MILNKLVNHGRSDSMSVMPSLYLSENVLAVITEMICDQDCRYIDKDSVPEYSNDSISTDNAQKSITTLKKIGLIDGDGFPTDLGRRWANRSTREEAAREIIAEQFPKGISRFFADPMSEDLVPFLMGYGEVTKSVAKKNAGFFRLLTRKAGILPKDETLNGSNPLAPNGADVVPAEKVMVLEIEVPLNVTLKELSEITSVADCKKWNVRIYEKERL